MIPSAPLGTDAAAGRPQGLGAAPGAGPDQAAAERRFRFELAAHPGSPAQARRLARARLTGWSVCEDTCDTAALVISELVTNAIVHTASDVVVCELLDGDDVLRIAVRDQGCTADDPHPSPQRPEEEHGRGLLLVEALCHAWGAQEHGSGLLVWADLPRGTDGPAQAAEPGDRADASAAAGEHAEPRDDLGWGVRPKPGPADGSGDEDEAVEQIHHDRTLRDTVRPEQALPEQALPEQTGRDRGPQGSARAIRPAPSRGAAEAYAAELMRRAPSGIPKPAGQTPGRPSAKEHRGPEQRAANLFGPDRRTPEQRVSDLCVLEHQGPSHHALDQTPFGHTPLGHTSAGHSHSHTPLSHRTTDHRTADHRAADHRATDHRTPDHCAPAHRAPDHRTVDAHRADERGPDHRTSPHQATSQSPAPVGPAAPVTPAGEASVPPPFPAVGGGTGLPRFERSRERGRA